MKKKAKRIIQFSLLFLVVIIILAIVLFNIFGENAIRSGVETAATKTLGVNVSLENIDLAILKGYVGLQGLVVGNPPEYQHENFMQLSKASVKANIGSFLSDTAIIDSINLDGIDLVIEQKGLTNNLQQILNNLPKSDDQSQTDQNQGSSKNLKISTLEISNVNVKVKLLPVPGKTDTISIKLAPIVMNDLGSAEKIDVGQLVSKILVAISKGIAQQGAGILPDDMLNAMSDTLDKTLGVAKDALKETQKVLESSKDIGEDVLDSGADAIESGKDAGKDVVEGLKGLFNSKPKE